MEKSFGLVLILPVDKKLAEFDGRELSVNDILSENKML